MRISVLLSWFDEREGWLYEAVASTAGLADRIVAVDGRYALYEERHDVSPHEQAEAIREACSDHEIGCLLHTPEHAWEGNEVEKRAHMFALALEDATPDDWFIILDGDETIDPEGTDPEHVRHVLATTTLDVATNRLRQPDQRIIDFRSTFRALPGLTVRGTHYHYTVDGRYLWHAPRGIQPEPAADIRNALLIHHRAEPRDEDRDEARQEYYRVRDYHGVEKTPR